MKILVLYLSTLILTVSSFETSEDKFLRKYGMIKIYESCFGNEVVKQIRKDMQAACAKCVVSATPPAVEPKPPKPDEVPENVPNQQKPTFDAEKLHQAILAYKPNTPPAPFYRPYAPSPAMSPYYNPLFNPGYQNPMFYPSFPQQFSPYGPVPLVGQQFYGNRMSRAKDIKEQLESLTTRVSGRSTNVTCVMQELGYLDANLEPNYEKILEKIGSLPVSKQLKKDMREGVEFCQQFSQCLPEVKTAKTPLSFELIRPMFFFKCYKQKKLEACVLKDLKEKFFGAFNQNKDDDDEDEDDELDSDDGLPRTGKSFKTPKSKNDIDELASSMYEFLYGIESNINLDGIL